MNIRTKLIVMMAVPLIALALVAVVGFRSQNTQSEVNEDAFQSVETIVNLDQLWIDIAIERIGVLTDDGAVAMDHDFHIAATNDTAARIVEAGDRFGAEVAAEAVEALPEVRGENVREALADYSAALDVVEQGIATQQLNGLDSDAVLTAVAMQEARQASRLQEEAWLQLLVADEVSPASVRVLISSFGSAETAREQASSITLSDGTQPFFTPAFSPQSIALGRVEVLVLAELGTADRAVLNDAFVEQSLSALPSLDLADSLVANRDEWTEASLISQQILRDEVAENFSEIEESRSLSLFLAILGGLLLFTLIFVIGRSILGPLSRLMENAGVMTNERLPAAVAQLRTIGASDEAPELAPIPKESDDEIGTIVEAFNEMQASALKVATDQARSRRKDRKSVV